MSRPSDPHDDLFAPTAPTAHHIHVSIGGWTYAPWRNNFYPEKLVQRGELDYASRHVSAIEVNGTYYGAQKPATYAKWRAETPDGFVFSLKAPRYTTDRAVLTDAGRTITAFIDGGLAELGDRLGPINWQFPPHKTFEHDDFAAFLDLLPRELDGRVLRHVLEVRHPSFMSTAYIELARRHRVATVCTDTPKYPSFADVTGDFVYVRLMCSEATVETGYRPAALAAWAERARSWANGGEPADLPRVGAISVKQDARDVFVYFINGAKERAPHAAMDLIGRVR